MRQGEIPYVRDIPMILIHESPDVEYVLVRHPQGKVIYNVPKDRITRG